MGYIRRYGGWHIFKVPTGDKRLGNKKEMFLAGMHGKEKIITSSSLNYLIKLIGKEGIGI
jgi:hypothetical protein